MEMKKLDFAETLKDSIAIGVKNAPSVVVAVALWLVTIWIPYINIGTTIAISLLPVELADVRQQVDDVSRDAGIRHHGGHRVRHLVRHLSGHQRRLHHLPRHVRPDRARGFGPDGDRRIVLETAERQRGISLRHYFPKTACGSSFFV